MHMRMRVCSRIEGASTNLIPDERGQKGKEIWEQKREGKM